MRRSFRFGTFGGGKDSAVLGQEHYGKTAPWRAWGESMAGHTLNLRHAECIFTQDRVTMPPVISLPLTVLLLLLICSLQLLCLAFSHSFTFFFVSSCGFPFHFFFFFYSLNQNGFEFSTSLLNKLLPCSFFVFIFQFHLSFFLSCFPPLPSIHCSLFPL